MLVLEKMHRVYGKTPPPLVTERVETELNTILDHNYDVIYMSAQKLVQNSLEHGYLVGSRGSVGSSMVAFLSAFEAPDLEEFPCLKLAMDCARRGGTAGCVMSAANEEAVHLFLKGKIGFNRIYDLAAGAVSEVAGDDAGSLETILLADEAESLSFGPEFQLLRSKRMSWNVWQA